MNGVLDLLKSRRVYFDGGMGSLLQKRGLTASELPEIWNLTHPEIIEEIHAQYIDAGADVITTNTFGINCLKHENYSELIKAAVSCAKKAVVSRGRGFVAFDIGPLGRFLEPIGGLPFEDAVEIFAKNIRVASSLGVDLIIIETMTDSYETKAAVLAAKENSDLPVFVTNVYDERGKMLTGADPEAMVALLEGLGVDALGINCSLGPDKMLPLIQRFYRCTSLPIICNPNAGLPTVADGEACYDMTPEAFAKYCAELAGAGASILGGCCGTEPSFIAEVVKSTSSLPLPRIEKKNICAVSSYTHAVILGNEPVLIGERINPTGKPKLKQALRDNNVSYILELGLSQADMGAHVLDVNVGLPDVDEAKLMKEAVCSLQSVTDLPLQLDSNDPSVLAQAMRAYNGKPMINSVNGDNESLDAILPLVKKYGGVVVALTLDKSGIHETVEGRINIAKRILKRAESYGIDKKDIIFDPLAMTIATDKNNARITLDTVKALCDMGLNTILGISNVSFGMPNRDGINSAFFALALSSGLSCAIINPLSASIMNAYRSYDPSDRSSTVDDLDTLIEKYQAPDIDRSVSEGTLKEYIVKGMLSSSVEKAKELLKERMAMEIIEDEIIPALGEVGIAFEEQKIYLPQLLQSAECSSKVFSILKDEMPASESRNESVIIATVKGDVHDIGKNIVKLLLESHGFNVFDLGKDVSPHIILDEVIKRDCKIVALSALMTTTLPAMKETVKLLKAHDESIFVMVGGAVLTAEYAESIGADAYGKDAMAAVRIVESFYK